MVADSKQDVRIDDLRLGRTDPKKVIHHAHCPHARADYIWARECGTVDRLASELRESGAHRWHHACQSCCGDLDDALYRRGVVLA